MTEVSAADIADEGIPFIGGEVQSPARDVLTVPDTNHVVG